MNSARSWCFCAAEQFDAADRGVAHRNADAGADLDLALAPVEMNGLGDDDEQPLRDPRRLVGVDVRDHHGELVPTETGGVVAGAQHLAQSAADATKHVVAGIVAESAVDLLESVEIDEQHRHIVVPMRQVIDQIGEAEPVRETGEWVGRALCLAQSPCCDVHCSGGKDEPDMEQRDLPQDFPRCICTEHTGRVDPPDQAVVQHDEQDRDEERHPVLVQRDEADHHEEVEVPLRCSVAPLAWYTNIADAVSRLTVANPER